MYIVPVQVRRVKDLSTYRLIDLFCSGNVEKEELRNQIQALAEDLKIVVKGRSYDSEKMILEKLLEAREDQVVVLCWNSKFEQSCLKSHLLACLRKSLFYY